MVKDILKLNKNPYICIPITGKTDGELLNELAEIILLKPDVIEWRVDFYEQINKTEAVLNMLNEMKKVTTVPLLFTIRSVEEGGEEISLNSRSEVFQLMKEVCRSSHIEMIDIEIANDDNIIKELQRIAQTHGVKTILSSHHFEKTPMRKELIQIGERAAELGGDIVKIAVTPRKKSDVLELLHVTNELDQTLEIPVVTMSMGKLGGISRLIGWTYGSMMTFAIGKKASAPGQLPIGQLREAIEKTQTLLKE